MSQEEGGDCFYVAARYVMDTPSLPDEIERRLCHGIALHAVDDQALSHAWVEVSTKEAPGIGMIWCIDRSNGNDAKLPRELYYHLGRIRDVHRYTATVAVEKMLTTGHYGPLRALGP